ncbi:MAG TPA: DUF3800 domain-containing protein [Pseudomonas xinjiangensis]|uniref:DUF3800 domain-containing protein n=2 Tax=root TaxID=1 RepID=A0A7V1BLT3_9GAMM|nr:DUF3800 domain-containing protein [Halopseudomonas xinjiangensis]HEC48316.1 DUF3800 domain-containing protein [Halopseudomonas xinjiangensis]
MTESINIYCDESCHLPNDGEKIMVLGAVVCPVDKAREIAVRLREIKQDHGFAPSFECKWNKVSPAKAAFYRDWLDYFFDDDDLSFRAVVADKTCLNHGAFNQDHDDWYFKMIFRLLEPIIKPQTGHRIYLDKKDTRSAKKVSKLHDVLCNNLYDFDREIIERVQVVESHAVEQLQLSDLLLGAVAYVNRDLSGNAGKDNFIDRLRQRSGYSLKASTLLREPKFNLFLWRGQSGAYLHE